jgi:ferritin-like protein
VLGILDIGSTSRRKLMAAEGYHEPYEQLTAKTRDFHRAYRSLMEELEAADWYQQRVDVCEDADLRAILAHNRDEEKEHAAMLLEWIRRHDSVFAAQLKNYLFSETSIVQKESATTGEKLGPAGSPPSIGSLRRAEGGK